MVHRLAKCFRILPSDVKNEQKTDSHPVQCVHVFYTHKHRSPPSGSLLQHAVTDTSVTVVW